MFGRLYWGELRKQTSGGAIITLSVITVVLALLMAVLFTAFNDLVNGVEEDIRDSLNSESGVTVGVNFDTGAPAVSSTGQSYTQEEVLTTLNYLYAELEARELQKEEEGYDYYRGSDYIYYVKGEIAFFEYLRDNELYGVRIGVMRDGAIASGEVTAEMFVTLMRSILFLLPLIYASIAAGSTFADEFKSGTIKLVLTRPVGVNALTTAKLLAAFTHAVAAYAAMFLLLVVLGYSFFPAENVRAVFMFNNSALTLAPSSAALGIGFTTDLIMLLSYTVIAFFVGVVTKNRVVAIITPIILVDVVGGIISLAGLGRFFISNALDWGQFVGISSTVTGGADFFISLPVWAVYMAAMLVLSYFVVKRRDAV